MTQSWKGYCRKIALGSGHAARLAMSCLRLNSFTPGAARKKLQDQLERGKVTQEQYEMRLYAIDTLAEMWKEGSETHIDPCINLGGWQSMGNGCHMKATHLTGN